MCYNLVTKESEVFAMAIENYRSRVHMLLLYPDNEKHVNAVEKIKQSYDYALILHNRDVTENGELKKEHWHCVVRFKNAVWSLAICKELGIDQNFIENVKRFDNALQYLIHYNDSDKAQYSIDEVLGNLKQKLVESINKLDKSEGEKVLELIEYIETQDQRISIKSFANFCAQQGYWAEFRRSASIFIKIIDEHNQKF